MGRRCSGRRTLGNQSWKEVNPSKIGDCPIKIINIIIINIIALFTLITIILSGQQIGVSVNIYNVTEEWPLCHEDKGFALC